MEPTARAGWWFPHRQLVAIGYKTQTRSPLAPTPSWAQSVGATGLGGMCLPDVTSRLYQSQVTGAKWLLCPEEQELRGLGRPGPTRYTGHSVGSGPQWGLGLLSRVDTLLAACILCGPNHLHPFLDLNVCP